MDSILILWMVSMNKGTPSNIIAELHMTTNDYAWLSTICPPTWPAFYADLLTLLPRHHTFYPGRGPEQCVKLPELNVQSSPPDPTDLLLKKQTPRLHVTRILLLWSIAACCHAAAFNKAGLLVVSSILTRWCRDAKEYTVRRVSFLVRSPTPFTCRLPAVLLMRSHSQVCSRLACTQVGELPYSSHTRGADRSACRNPRSPDVLVPPR